MKTCGLPSRNNQSARQGKPPFKLSTINLRRSISEQPFQIIQPVIGDSGFSEADQDQLVRFQSKRKRKGGWDEMAKHVYRHIIMSFVGSDYFCSILNIQVMNGNPIISNTSRITTISSGIFDLNLFSVIHVTGQSQYSKNLSEEPAPTRNSHLRHLAHRLQPVRGLTLLLMSRRQLRLHETPRRDEKWMRAEKTRFLHFATPASRSLLPGQLLIPRPKQFGFYMCRIRDIWNHLPRFAKHFPQIG